MGKTTELRREIKDAFIPFAEQRGFSVSNRNMPVFIEFLKISGDTAQLFDIQWEKYGKPRFVVNYGSCPAAGLDIDGRKLPPEEIPAGWAPVRGRLQPGKGALTSSWFRQDKPLLVRLMTGEGLYPAKQVVEQLIGLFPELEAFWDKGILGPHMKPLPVVTHKTKN